MNQQPLTLEEIHEETIGILSKIISICDELEINYFLAYGSLLGAVRHQGFIPWDDDLDLIMLRPEYDKFLQYCTEHEEELFPYKLMGRHNTPGFPFTITRFCDLRYRMVSDEITDAGMGMFVDIYPFDGAGVEQDDAMKKTGKMRQIYLNCAFCALRKRYHRSSKGLLYNFIKFPSHCFARIMGADFFLDRMEKFKDTFPLEESKYVICMVWDGIIKLNEKKHFEEFTYLPFEGLQVKVPKEYDAVLRASYGDYMRLPPEERRIPHHEYHLYRKPEFFESK